MRLHKPMIDLVRKAHDSGRLLAAICQGPQLLISAEVVRRRKVTSWPSIAIDLKNAGALWFDKAVIRDGNLITSRQPADTPEFNAAIIETLQGQESKNVIPYCVSEEDDSITVTGDVDQANQRGDAESCRDYLPMWPHAPRGG